MTIKAIVIEGVNGDIEITRTSGGAMVTRGHDILCEVARDEPREARYAHARPAFEAVYGADRRGRVKATNSMVHDVLSEIERVAGC